MSADLLEQALNAFGRRRPFRPYFVEFNSGGQFLAPHPETVRREGALFVGRTTDGRYEVFPAENVSRLVEAPASGPA
jgi:hypothetical protein